MKKTGIHFMGFIAVILGILTIQSCEKEENSSGGVTNISSYNASESHNTGINCMECHHSGGPGEGWFVVAGTVYDESGTSTYPGATVRLYTGANGTGELKATVEVDKKGNFYTTTQVDFGSGLYPAVEGSTSTQYMDIPVTTGACNSCHGVSEDRIWTR